MDLDSVRGLKVSLTETVIKPMASLNVARKSFGIAAQPMSRAEGGGPTMALGVVRRSETDYQLAVRIQRRGLENSSQLDKIRKEAIGEVDVRYVGRVVKLAAVSPQQKKARPLKIGVSVGHHEITAGTLGCFVRGLNPADKQAVMILSNNHVLANENKAKAGDANLQPGKFDEGKEPDDKVATLTRFVKLQKAGPNLVDAAVARVDPEIKYNAKALPGLDGPLAGVGPSFLDVGTTVAKVGRTTGTTHGKVTAFELDGIYISYGPDDLRFDGQIEIEGTWTGPFSQPGDSGSLIVDADFKAVALLFAGGDQGGSNGQGLTYANPIDAVLRELKVELITS